MRLATGAGITEGGVGGNLRATEASSSCQVQTSTQDNLSACTLTALSQSQMKIITMICIVKWLF